MQRDIRGVSGRLKPDPDCETSAQKGKICADTPKKLWGGGDSLLYPFPGSVNELLQGHLKHNPFFARISDQIKNEVYRESFVNPKIHNIIPEPHKYRLECAQVQDLYNP